MAVIRVNFPATLAGRDELRAFIAVCGVRESYYGGPLLSDTDWDAEASQGDDLFADYQAWRIQNLRQDP